MLISELINVFKTLALKHRNINSFALGDQYLIESGLEHDYPKFFLETPFNISFPMGDRPAFYTVSFAFYILINAKEDDVDDQVQAVSDSAEITEQFLTYLDSQESREYSIISTNSLTYNDTTNEGLSTTRTDITMSLLRNVCDDDKTLNEIFNK